jgi:hypothetical protein
VTAKGRFQVARSEFKSKERVVPVTVYSETKKRTDQALKTVLDTLADNEKTFGPYAHHFCVVYVTPGGGGMEYAGATATAEWAIAHEITHSWFARGVMPADGNAGWIDEAVTSWRDDRYLRAKEDFGRRAAKMSAFPPYRRHTPMEAYTHGKNLMSQLDRLFAQTGGLRPVLQRLYADRARTRITTEFFRDFVQKDTGQNLSAIFDRYVFGQNIPMSDRSTAAKVQEHHPLPFTAAERALFR